MRICPFIDVEAFRKRTGGNAGVQPVVIRKIGLDLLSAFGLVVRLQVVMRCLIFSTAIRNIGVDLLSTFGLVVRLQVVLRSLVFRIAIILGLLRRVLRISNPFALGIDTLFPRVAVVVGSLP